MIFKILFHIFFRHFKIMGNSNKSVQKKSTNSPKKINKNLQLLPELPDMYIPLESGIVRHPD